MLRIHMHICIYICIHLHLHLQLHSHLLSALCALPPPAVQPSRSQAAHASRYINNRCRTCRLGEIQWPAVEISFHHTSAPPSKFAQFLPDRPPGRSGPYRSEAWPTGPRADITI